MNLTTKEMTECCASVGESLAVQKIQPSGTLAYRFLKRLFDFVFSLCVSVVLVIPVAIVCAFICLESPGNPLYAQEPVGEVRNVRIVGDVSSVEVFVNDGALVFSTRIYPEAYGVTVEAPGASVTYHALNI